MSEPRVSLVAVAVAVAAAAFAVMRVGNLNEVNAGDDDVLDVAVVAVVVVVAAVAVAVVVVVVVVVVGLHDEDHVMQMMVRDDGWGFENFHTSYLAARCQHWLPARAGTARGPKDVGRLLY